MWRCLCCAQLGVVPHEKGGLKAGAPRQPHGRQTIERNYLRDMWASTKGPLRGKSSEMVTALAEWRSLAESRFAITTLRKQITGHAYVT
jgi:hypothetical protein